MRTPLLALALCLVLSAPVSTWAQDAAASDDDAAASDDDAAAEPVDDAAEPVDDATEPVDDAAEPGDEAPDAMEVVPEAVESTPETARAVPEAVDVPAPLQQLEREPGTRKGMMIAGWATTGGTWGLTALVGLTMIQMGLEADSDPYTECVNCYTAGPRLLIPIVGPFLALPVADGTDGKVVTFVLCAAQVTGLSLGIAGTKRFKHDKAVRNRWRAEHASLRGWQLTPTVASLGRDEATVPALLLDGRF